MLEGSGTMKVDGDAVALGDGRLPSRRCRVDTSGHCGARRAHVCRRRRQAAAGIRRPPVSVSAITGVHHVQVAAPPGCEDAAREFYAGLLGLTEIEKPPLLAIRGGCWFRVGAGELHVGVEEPFAPATKAHPAFSRRVRRGARAACVVTRDRRDRGSLGGRRRDPDTAAVSRQRSVGESARGRGDQGELARSAVAFGRRACVRAVAHTRRRSGTRSVTTPRATVPQGHRSCPPGGRWRRTRTDARDHRCRDAPEMSQRPAGSLRAWPTAS